MPRPLVSTSSLRSPLRAPCLQPPSRPGMASPRGNAAALTPSPPTRVDAGSLDPGPLPPLCSPHLTRPPSEVLAERSLLSPGSDWPTGRGGLGRALSGTGWGLGATPGWQECGGWGCWPGRGCRLLFWQVPGMRLKKRPPHHISPFGRPAAQISYLKPKQICRGQRREQACDIRQLSLSTIPIKPTPEAQAREGGWGRGWGPDSLLDTSRRVSGTGVPWAEMSPRPLAASHGLSGLHKATVLGPREDISKARLSYDPTAT